ncbi:hypothetical protein LCGC14_2190040 [marine sediment metagenome]|uniref:Uncharacterized protein n=1 Tax=marine sediment metagenome TaxID=412755 RepID=A0A0F9E6U9_9ZZZZ
MKYKEIMPEFMEILDKRMMKGFEEYGDESFDKPSVELVDEIIEEVEGCLDRQFCLAVTAFVKRFCSSIRTFLA